MPKHIQFQLECLAAELTAMLMAEYGWDMHRALDELYSSATFAKLNDPLCGLYYQGAVYIFQFLKSEIETGKIAFDNISEDDLLMEDGRPLTKGALGSAPLNLRYSGTIDISAAEIFPVHTAE